MLVKNKSFIFMEPYKNDITNIANHSKMPHYFQLFLNQKAKYVPKTTSNVLISIELQTTSNVVTQNKQPHNLQSLHAI